MLGIMAKLNEASKGNLESVSGMSLENVFNNYMTAFIQPTTRIELFSKEETPTQQHPIDGGNRMVGCCDAAGAVNIRKELFSKEPTATQQDPIDGVGGMADCGDAAAKIIMKRGEVEPPRNHQKRRLQSTNEKMRNSSKKGRCSLCWLFGHRATGAGMKCEVVSRLREGVFPRLPNPRMVENNCCKRKRRRHVMSKLRREARSLCRVNCTDIMFNVMMDRPFYPTNLLDVGECPLTSNIQSNLLTTFAITTWMYTLALQTAWI
jgi:hypothetical protein